MTTDQNKIVCLYDYDGTLIPESMFHPILARYNIDANTFFDESNKFRDDATEGGLLMNEGHAYMNMFLKYINQDRLPKFTNQDLRNLGSDMEFFPGVVDYFQRTKEFVKQEYGNEGITLEHHIVSTGNRQVILGSAIAPFTNQVYASDYISGSKIGLGTETIASVTSAIGPNQKPVHFFAVNKGADENPLINIQSRISKEERKVPFTNMIYVADGFTDIPPFALLYDRGGLCVGVYDDNESGSYERGKPLVTDQRVHHLLPADYRKGSDLSNILEGRIRKVADIIRDGTRQKSFDF